MSEITDRPLTADELYALPDTDSREELVAGAIVREPPAGFGHGTVEVRIAFLLEEWVRAGGLGRVVTEAGFVLARDPDTVRSPDVAFVAAERVEEGTAHGPYFEGAPDLAVEILSLSNTEREMAAKAREYLAAGTRLVWVVDPDGEEITVYRAGAPPHRLGRRDMLDGGDVLPGFAALAARILR